MQFKMMNNAVFGNTMENVREHRDIILASTERRILASTEMFALSEPNYHTTKLITENLLPVEMKKSEFQ